MFCLLAHSILAFFCYESLCLQRIPLYTTASSYPWYNTQAPQAISIPPTNTDDEDNNQTFLYRYVIWRAGVFYRWEQPSDGPSDEDDEEDVDMTTTATATSNVDMPLQAEDEEGGVKYHSIPLRLLSNRETYVVNDILGVTSGLIDLDLLRSPSEMSIAASALHSRDMSGQLSQHGLISSASATNTATQFGGTTSTSRNKKVGFAAVPPPYHPNKTTREKQAVHLNSTDGLVVVSAFLPVHLHRSEDGEWTADWDYEMLLSMQTHLRVTRIGVVKWRGWHGNRGPDGSPEAGVPRNERHKVEACLAPFSCVPVWIKPIVFGEM